MSDLGSGSADGARPGIGERTREVVRIVEADHKATIELISRLTTIRTGLRGVVITLASTVLGVALTRSSWPLAAFGIPVVLAGYFAEARFEFLVRLAHDRAVRLERKVQAYVATLVETGVVLEDAEDDFRREIESYQFGSSRSLRGPSAPIMVRKSLRDVMTWVYALFVVGLTVLAFVLGLGGDGGDGAPAGSSCLRVGDAVVEIRGPVTVRSGHVGLSGCPPAPR